MNDGFIAPLRIDADHPALAGHFPTRPVVPGVVVLERVAAALRQWRGTRVAGFDAKFVRPLLPGQDAAIELRGNGPSVRFAVTRDDAVLASGILETAP
jgi:3-hydroxyacyl-[acyl-carrier-protein] dehydratase